jgi:hypothetical protein
MTTNGPDYRAHPLLDPSLSETDPTSFRMLYKKYLEALRSAEGYNDFLNKMLYPVGEEQSLESNLESARYYLNEAMQYTAGLIQLMPDEAGQVLAPVPEVRDCSDIMELLSVIFGNTDARVRFEAQRKLYLSKLFFDVDHCREVQEGVAHKETFERLLQKQLFTGVVNRQELDVSFGIGPDGLTMEYSINGGPRPDREHWTFDMQEIQLLHQGWPIRLHVYFYSCRFKKEIMAFQYRKGLEHYALQPMEIWSELEHRRSGSIVSKMIRTGVNDPRQIKDLIGAMFIVENLVEVEHLKEVLVGLFGGPFRVKNVVDTLSGPAQVSQLNPYSGAGYKVFKCELDVLYRNPNVSDSPPYFFPIEIQIYTLESYLRTIHTEHYANHQTLKRRQFLLGLCPYLFPVVIYGEEPLRLCTVEGVRTGTSSTV